MYDDLHEKVPFHDGTFTDWSPKWSRATPYHYKDGVQIWVSRHDLTPDDDFLKQRRDSEGGESFGNEA